MASCAVPFVQRAIHFSADSDDESPLRTMSVVALYARDDCFRKAFKRKRASEEGASDSKQKEITSQQAGGEGKAKKEALVTENTKPGLMCPARVACKVEEVQSVDPDVGRQTRTPSLGLKTPIKTEPDERAERAGGARRKQWGTRRGLNLEDSKHLTGVCRASSANLYNGAVGLEARRLSVENEARVREPMRIKREASADGGGSSGATSIAPVNVIDLDGLDDDKDSVQKVQPLECGCCCESVTHFSSLHCGAGHRLCNDCIIQRANGVVFDKESDAAWGLECFALSESKCPKALSLEVLQGLLPEPLYEKLRLKCLTQDFPLEKDKRKLTKSVLCPSCKEWWRVGTRATIISTDPILKHFCKSTCIRCKQIWKQGHKCAALVGAEEGTGERVADAQAGQGTQTKRSLKSDACKASIGKGLAGAERVGKVARTSRQAERGGQRHSCASEAFGGSGDMSRGPDRSSGSRTEEDELRLQREEALTAAVLSSCPECGVEVDKNNGCNKVHCGNCRTSFCFLCKSKIRRGEGYTHFCVHSTREGTQERCAECGKCKTSSTNKKRKDEKRAEVEKKFQNIEANRASS